MARETHLHAHQTVAVCICTYKRPSVLNLLLDRLSEVVANVPDVNVSIVVIDDDPSGSAQAVCRSATQKYEFALVYQQLGSENISAARNAAIGAGSAVASWLAFIDDDCLPGTGWIRELLEVQRLCQAECVSGACTDAFPPNAPRWILDEPFFDPPADLFDGQAVEMGYLKNTLVSADFLRRHSIDFDEKFGGTGGEDAMFFYTASDFGMKHHHSSRAVVSELIPPKRVTISYQLRRRFWYGNTEALTSIASGRVARFRMAASGGKKMMSGLARPFLRLTRSETLQLRFALSEVLRGFGRLLGSLGFSIRHH